MSEELRRSLQELARRLQAVMAIVLSGPLYLRWLPQPGERR